MMASRTLRAVRRPPFNKEDKQRRWSPAVLCELLPEPGGNDVVAGACELSLWT